MRTTIEIDDDDRSKLAELAAERGVRGFSGLVREAITLYLTTNEARRERVEAALKVLGSLSEKEADALEDSVRRVRATWR